MFLATAGLLGLMTYLSHVAGFWEALGGQLTRDNRHFLGILPCAAALWVLTIPPVLNLAIHGGRHLVVADGNLVIGRPFGPRIPIRDLLSVKAGPEGGFAGEPGAILLTARRFGRVQTYSVNMMLYREPYATIRAGLTACGAPAEGVV